MDWANYSSEVQFLMQTIDANSHVYYEIRQLHRKDLKDIRDTIEALQNMMPQIEPQPFCPIRHDQLVGTEAYVVGGFSPETECDEDSDCFIVKIPTFRGMGK